MASRRIRHHLRDFVLSVETAMTAAVRLRSPPPSLCQPGTGLDLNAPALVLGEVPMQDVHPMQGQRLNLLLHEIHVLEMAASV